MLSAWRHSLSFHVGFNYSSSSLVYYRKAITPGLALQLDI
ncbi:hypothetical protein KIS4809_1684 [Bacillus sp. ZZV12-4809]|nr:hypothetical protein KIS4809_1684 [Bacillus sp. ZZV12-4809]